jgi:hypothetical protein
MRTRTAVNQTNHGLETEELEVIQIMLKPVD